LPDFNRKISELKSRIEEELNQRLVLREPISLYEPMRYAITGGGKRLRPILVILACEAVGGKITDSLNAAVAVELLHNFTLVHDDIMDRDDKRRGRETVHKKWNQDVAILAGDGLLALAYDSLMRTQSPLIQIISNLFTEALLEVCEGQALDSEYETRDQVTLADYFTMIDKKTAKLFAMSCHIGALCGGCNDSMAENLKKFGEFVGRAFQVQDDLLDITSEEKILGKSFGSDIRQGKKTFLLIHALQNASDEDQKLMRRILISPHIEFKVRDMKAIFEKAGTIRAAKLEIKKALTSAGRCLKMLSDSQHRVALEEIVQMLAKRNY
jgi:geranylgeranyl diphosphate synthase type II